MLQPLQKLLYEEVFRKDFPGFNVLAGKSPESKHRSLYGYGMTSGKVDQ